MNRILIITSCMECPFLYGDNDCLHEEMRGKDTWFKDRTKLPDWCPLTTVQEYNFDPTIND